MRYRMLLWLTGILLSYPLASFVAAWFFIRPYHKPVGPPPADFPIPLQEVSFRTGDGLTLRGWYAPPPEGHPVILLLHGYRSTRTQTLERARWLAEQGYGVLMYDARGCGESEGDQVTVGYREVGDLLAAIRFLRQRGIKDIGCVGISQGGATILMAAEHLEGIACVVVESSYTNIIEAVDRRFRHFLKIPGHIGAALMVPFAELLTGVSAVEINPEKHAPFLPCPVFILSGTADTRTWVQDTVRLYGAAPSPKRLWLVEGADHEDLYAFAPEEYRRRVGEFLKTYLPIEEQ